MRHGGDLGPAIARYGIAPGDWLDLSTGINPHAYPLDEEAGAEAETEDRRLPDPVVLEALLDAARSAYRVPAGLDICAAPGTEILIRLLPWLTTGETVLLSTTYGSYRESWNAADKPLASVSPEECFGIPAGTNILLVNPNNPDGRCIDRPTLKQWADTRGAPARLIVDEAFADADEDCSLVPDLSPNDPVIILRSFGKFFGLPGLRLGFAVGMPRQIRLLAAMLGDWPVSARALRFGVAALKDWDWQSAMRRRLAAEAASLDEILLSAGLDIAGGTNLFRLVLHPDAASLQDHLAGHGIWVRVFEEEPGLVRIGLPGTEAGMMRLDKALSTLAG